MNTTAVTIVLSEEERLDLEELVQYPKAGRLTAQRARIVSSAADGMAVGVTANSRGVKADTVRKRRLRFAERRLVGPHERSRRSPAHDW